MFTLKFGPGFVLAIGPVGVSIQRDCLIRAGRHEFYFERGCGWTHSRVPERIALSPL